MPETKKDNTSATESKQAANSITVALIPVAAVKRAIEFYDEAKGVFKKVGFRNDNADVKKLKDLLTEVNPPTITSSASKETEYELVTFNKQTHLNPQQTFKLILITLKADLEPESASYDCLDLIRQTICNAISEKRFNALKKIYAYRDLGFHDYIFINDVTPNEAAQEADLLITISESLTTEHAEKLKKMSGHALQSIFHELRKQIHWFKTHTDLVAKILQSDHVLTIISALQVLRESEKMVPTNSDDKSINTDVNRVAIISHPEHALSLANALETLKLFSIDMARVSKTLLKYPSFALDISDAIATQPDHAHGIVTAISKLNQSGQLSKEAIQQLGDNPTASIEDAKKMEPNGTLSQAKVPSLFNRRSNHAPAASAQHMTYIPLSSIKSSSIRHGKK